MDAYFENLNTPKTTFLRSYNSNFHPFFSITFILLNDSYKSYQIIYKFHRVTDYIRPLEILFTSSIDHLEWFFITNQGIFSIFGAVL